MKIILPGGAGLVGQNLVARLKEKGYSNIIVLDKHRANLEVLKYVQPEITVEYADLAEPGEWQRYFVGADAVVMLQAQIGGLIYEEFVTYDVTVERHIAHLDRVGTLRCLPLGTVRGIAGLVERVLANVDALVRVHFHIFKL